MRGLDPYSSEYSNPEETLKYDGKDCYIKDEKIVLVRTVSDEECFGEYKVPYIITKDF